MTAQQQDAEFEPVFLQRTGSGFYVSAADGTGGRSFARLLDAQLYYAKQRRIERQREDAPSTEQQPSARTGGGAHG